MKKLRSLVASFALATASLTGLTAAQPAAAQTVYTQQEEYSNPAYVTQDAINDIAQNLGVQAVYPRRNPSDRLRAVRRAACFHERPLTEAPYRSGKQPPTFRR